MSFRDSTPAPADAVTQAATNAHSRAISACTQRIASAVDSIRDVQPSGVRRG